MRLLRVRLADYRGVEACEVAFAERGVTVVEGPNEVGKSSLVEAVGLLLEYKDSSKAGPVRAVQPVGRDVGSEVEVELRLGETHLTCRKRFHRQTATELTVHAPAHEQLTGDDAHDRLRALVDERVDRTLLEQLWFRQGSQLRRLALGDSAALGAALDDGDGADPADDDLLARARAESERHWTPKGRPRQELADADAAAERARLAEADLAERVAALDEDVQAAERLAARRAELEADLAERRPELERHEAALAEVRALEQEVERLAAQAEGAEARREQAAATLEARRALVARVDELAGRVAELRDDPAAADRAARLEGLDAELERRRAAAERATEDAKAAREEERLRRDDLELLGLVAERDDLAERRRRVAAAREAAEEHEAFLAACRVDEEALARLHDAETAVDLARRQLDADAPRLEVAALTDVDVAVDGQAARLAAGETRDQAVPGEAVVRVAELAEVRLRAGTSAEALVAAHRDAEAALERACGELGVADVAEARAELARRREAERAVAERDREVAAALGDLDAAALDARLDELRAQVDGRLARRPEEPPLPDDLAAARQAAEAATAAREAADAAEEEASAEREALRSTVEDLRGEHQGHDAELAAARRQHDDEAHRLAAEREAADDEALAERAREAETAAAEAAERRAEARRRLDGLDPERVALLADNARAAVEGLDEQLRAVRDEEREVRERLRVLGQEGLGGRLEAARDELARAEADRDRRWRRARAAKLLHDTLVAERDRVRAAYRAPLRREIAQVAALVHDGEVDVELDDDLGVAARSLAGTTVPWSELSSGAKEQLSLVVALAAARLVADEGVPLVLDDLLGYTDPERLERLGAVLARVGQDHQVIVLTSAADRYRHVGGAHHVRLG